MADTLMLVHVHISNLAAQTGASLFLHTRAPPSLAILSPNGTQPAATWVYDKTENLSVDALTRAKDVTHLIAEAAALSPADAEGWVLFNDEKVVKADTESVRELKKLAYLYVFERV